jgi:hypothetical protein
MSNERPEQKYQRLFEELYNLCKEQGWGDPFSYARSREIHLACILGHKICSTYSGADAFDEDGGSEYKSTTARLINGSYNGISVQDSWEEQERYLIEEKIGKYANHYIARYNESKIEEIWKLSSNDVLTILLPKLKKDWERKKSKVYKDPRLSATVSSTEIKRYGEQLQWQ